MPRLAAAALLLFGLLLGALWPQVTWLVSRQFSVDGLLVGTRVPLPPIVTGVALLLGLGLAFAAGVIAGGWLAAWPAFLSVALGALVGLAGVDGWRPELLPYLAGGALACGGAALWGARVRRRWGGRRPKQGVR